MNSMFTEMTTEEIMMTEGGAIPAWLIVVLIGAAISTFSGCAAAERDDK